MNGKRRTALTIAAAAACMLCLPVAVSAAISGGTFLSKGLVYEDVYGVTNGNAIMTNTLGSGENAKVQRDLVGSDGTVKFSMTYVPGLNAAQPAGQDYRPELPTGSAQESGFALQRGCMVVVQNATDKRCLVNADGKIVVKGADSITIVPTRERAVSFWSSNSSTDIKLHDLQTGKVLNEIKGYRTDGKVIDSYREGSTSANIIALPDNGDYRTTSVIVDASSDKLKVTTEQLTDYRGIVYKDETVEIKLDGNSSLLFSFANGTTKTIEGPFSYANANHGTHVQAGVEGAGQQYYTLKGEPLFPGKPYIEIEKIDQSSSYLCTEVREANGAHQQVYSVVDSATGKEISIDSVQAPSSVTYSVVGEYIVGHDSKLAGNEYIYGDTKVLDVRGKVVKTYQLSSQIHFSTTGFYDYSDKRIDLVPYVERTTANTSTYLDASLNTIMTTEGYFDGAPIDVDGGISYGLNKTGDWAQPNLPLYDAHLKPLKIHGYQRISAGAVAQRDDINYVIDSNGMMGAVNGAGKVVIPLAYQGIYDLGEDADNSTILVKKDGAWYFLGLHDGQQQKPAVNLTDVNGNTPHREHIQWLADNGITTGFKEQDGTFTFRPYDKIARCDMAAFLYRLAGEPDYEPTAQEMAYFKDVNTSTPHAKAIWWAVSQGITKGWDEADGSKTFRPYGKIARCDMAAFLYRFAGEPAFDAQASMRSYFRDVNASTPHSKAVLWTASQGISEGWKESDGTRTFRPMDQIARCDMAAFLHRMEQKGLVK